MPKFELALTFDDVLLAPQHSDIESRKDVSLRTSLGNLHLKIPILSANMDSVTGPAMARKMGELGGAGVLHRYAPQSDIKEWVKTLLELNLPAIPSIGVQEIDRENALVYYDKGVDVICVDVAHGDHCLVERTVEYCAKLGFGTIIAGNVATPSGVKRLCDAGANVIKVGVGPGAVCTTRIVTGHGVPQLTAILNCATEAKRLNCSLIADGGIRNSGDCVKALAAGASAVMLGSVLSGTWETPGEIKRDNDKQFKIYRGMASEDAQLAFKGKIGNDVAEGVSTLVEIKGFVESEIKAICGGIRSGFSYSGAKDLRSLWNNATFMQMTQSGMAESKPHGLKK